MNQAMCDPAYAELGDTAREYTLRMVELSSQAATSGMNRELATAFTWISGGLAFLQKNVARGDLAGLLREQHQLAEECQDLVIQDVRNTLQIAELTKAELIHWQKRWAAALIRSAFAPYRQQRLH